jgi:hypothetical protein
MAQQQEPKKPKRPKSKRLNLSSKKQWESILRDIDKPDVPIEMMERVVVSLTDGTTVIIDIKAMLAEGADPDFLKIHLDERLDSLDHIIEDVDFYVNVDEVRKTVQPLTDSILKNL